MLWKRWFDEKALEKMKTSVLYAKFSFPLWQKSRVKEQYHWRALSPYSRADKREVGSDLSGSRALRSIFIGLTLLTVAGPTQAQTLEQIVSEAKKEGEVTLVASASTFGGKKGFAELENLFAKRYGFKAKVN